MTGTHGRSTQPRALDRRASQKEYGYSASRADSAEEICVTSRNHGRSRSACGSKQTRSIAAASSAATDDASAAMLQLIGK